MTDEEMNELLGIDAEELEDKNQYIYLNENWRIKYLDKLNLVLQKKIISTKKESKKKIETWKDEGYYSNIEMCWYRFVDKVINPKVAEGVEELIKAIEELKSLKELKIDEFRNIKSREKKK